MKREKTRQTTIGNVFIGGQNKVLIQSMCKHKTSDINSVINEINECAKMGADLMRVAVLDEQDALAIKTIVQQSDIPLIADIHFDGRLAIAAMANGVQKIRLNPGNIKDENTIKAVVEAAKKHGVAIRVGANSGSINDEVDILPISLAEKLVLSAQKQIKILEKYNFFEIVVSLKASGIKETIAAYRLASELFPYPLHLGITEAGPKDISLVRSAAGLAPLLLEGIGDTIRISMTGNARDEVLAAKRLLHDCGLFDNYPTLISCPTCGRTQVDVHQLATKIFAYLEERSIPLAVAVMGCVVNGPGEGKSADLGIAGGKGQYVIFKKGQLIKKVSEADAYDTMIKEIESMR
ncbi:MAG: flavodoxin-dependent (E)-4-hydroxy-3-methylbut-2-enyl-diphosphate synthase [Erysipelotrichia bacterium]|nr:flavodoxin-dependent (E)-4-hydroxy-3-methylbut-2-enyl-diphosphate synthase [Erysipelotrichia bacterium]